MKYPHLKGWQIVYSNSATSSHKEPGTFQTEVSVERIKWGMGGKENHPDKNVQESSAWWNLWIIFQVTPCFNNIIIIYFCKGTRIATFTSGTPWQSLLLNMQRKVVDNLELKLQIPLFIIICFIPGQLYEEVLEKPLLKETKAYYRREAAELHADNTCHAFITKVQLHVHCKCIAK